MSESLVTNLSKSALLIILDSTGHSPSAHRAAQPQTAFPHSRYRSRFRIRRPTFEAGIDECVNARESYCRKYRASMIARLVSSQDTGNRYGASILCFRKLPLLSSSVNIDNGRDNFWADYLSSFC